MASRTPKQMPKCSATTIFIFFNPLYFVTQSNLSKIFYFLPALMIRSSNSMYSRKARRPFAVNE